MCDMFSILRSSMNHSPSSHVYSRREMLSLSGKIAIASTLAPHFCFAKIENSSNIFGSVVGDSVAAKIGETVLKEGGNAIDAAVATALAAAIVSPSKCGIGGYGGHATIGRADGKITSIDFNSAAPAAAREDMFPLDEKGNVKGNLNSHGWLAAAVPGTMAGLQLALERYGTRSLRDVLAPSIQLCEEGVYLAPIKGIDDASRNDPRPDSTQTDSSAGRAKQRNLALAKLLKTLAKRNSVESFYHGDIARKIAEAFQKNGGLVTFEDMSAYRAREVEPVKLDWNGMTIHTAPLTSPGLMLLEAMSILKTLDWEKLSAQERLHAKIEALRIAWADRNEFFGDPEKVKVPVEKLVSSNHIGQMAEKVRAALKAQKPVSLKNDSSKDAGTINITAADRQGNMIALTLTHGGSFGARVSVEELGMVLGHGMWRFNPRPGHPNSPGPGKRAVNNMCPTIVTREGKPIFALGAAGGTRIPNTIYEVLINYVGLNQSMDEAMNAPRVDTTGELKLGLEKTHSPDEEKFLQKIGYNTSYVNSAYVSAVSFDAKTKECRGISNGGA